MRKWREVGKIGKASMAQIQLGCLHGILDQLINILNLIATQYVKHWLSPGFGADFKNWFAKPEFTGLGGIE